MGGEFKDKEELNEWLRRNREPEIIFTNERNIVDYIREKEKIKMEGLVEGRVVHFVLDNQQITNEGGDTSDISANKEIITCRPAIIVNAWGGKLENGMINIQVFLDGMNDVRLVEEIIHRPIHVDNYQLNFGHLWLTSVKYSESKEVATWHWPERS